MQGILQASPAVYGHLGDRVAGLLNVRPRHAYPVDGEAVSRWRVELRRALAEALGLPPEPPALCSAWEAELTDRGELLQAKWVLEREDGVRIPVYRLTPKAGPTRSGAVLVFHGHNPNVQFCLGNYPDEETARLKRAKDNHYAEALARAGWEVFAVEQQGFGERQGPDPAPLHDDTIVSSCRNLSILYQAVGKTLLGERILDARTVLGWLKEKPGARVAATGNSGGGTTALWLGALDDRLDVCVPGSYLCRFRDSIYAVRHCDCNYVPGLAGIAEMGDIAALIAPRPFRAIHGERDPIYPIEGTRRAFDTVRRAYRDAGAEDRCSLAVHPGEHAYRISDAVEWLEAWL